MEVVFQVHNRDSRVEQNNPKTYPKDTHSGIKGEPGNTGLHARSLELKSKACHLVIFHCFSTWAREEMTANSEGFLVDQVSWEELKVGVFRFLFVSETK